MSIFDKRVNYKPFEYPEVNVFIDAMNKTFWVHSEVEFDPSIQDFKILPPHKKELFVRAVLSIAQVEVAVKTFWGELYNHFPKPEFNNLGSTFAESETRHSEAYSRVLDVLNLNERFSEILEVPAFKRKLALIEKVMKDPTVGIETKILFFTLVIENSSLFAQFGIATSFARFEGTMKNLSNMISWSAIDEDCFHPDTEVLTPKGWKNIKEFKVGDEVYGFKDGVSTIEKVQKVINKPFEGNLVNIVKSNDMQQLVTPGHDVIVNNNYRGWIKEKAGNIKLNHNKKFPTSSIVSTKGRKELTFLERLHIAVQADGSVKYWKNKEGAKVVRGGKGGHNIVVALTREHKKERFEGILNNTGIEYKKEYRIKESGREETRFLFFLPDPEKYKTLSGFDLSQFSVEGVRDFMDEVFNWDGSKETENCYVYSNCDKPSVDKMVEASLLSGRFPNVMEVRPKKEGHQLLYKLSVRDRYKDNLVTAKHFSKSDIPYSGNVHCVTVPSGGLITRINDKTFISGNCHSQAGIWILNEIQKEKEIFQDINIKEVVEEYVQVESEMLDWIFEEGEFEHFSKEDLLYYIKYRLDKALTQINFPVVFNVTPEQVKPMMWFEEEIYANSLDDFFAKRPTEYTKHDKSFTADDLF